LVDLCVVGDVAGENQRAVELGRELGEALLEALVLIGEGELGALAVAGLGNAVGDRMLGQKARDQNALVCKKSHVFSNGEC